MDLFYDTYCPFCHTDHAVELYAERTSAYDTLYRCMRCYKVFDQKEKEVHEIALREERRKKQKTKQEEVKKTAKTFPMRKFIWISLIIVIIIGFVSNFFF